MDRIALYENKLILIILSKLIHKSCPGYFNSER